ELALDAGEAAHEALPFAAREQPCADEPAYVRDAAGDVLRIEPAIDGQRARETLDDRRGRLVESSRPGLRRRRARAPSGAHVPPRWASARMRRRSPFRRMNPVASSCR